MRPFAVIVFLRQRERGGEISPRAVALALGFIGKPSTGVCGYIGWINFDHCLEVAKRAGDFAFGAPGVAAAVEGVRIGNSNGLLAPPPRPHPQHPPSAATPGPR